MAQDSSPDRDLDDVLDGLRYAMVITASGGGLTSRPLTLVEVDGGNLHFLVSKSADWAVDIRNGATDVHAAFSYPDKNMFVSLAGTAVLSEDGALIDRLWNPAAAAFFEGKDDPDLAALSIDVASGEWWDGPSGKLGRALAIVKAAVSDGDAAGDRGSVRTD